jgi:hypothetical protein
MPYQTVEIDLRDGERVKVFTSRRVKSALAELLEGNSLYLAARQVQVLEAFYKQGKKDGARAAFEQVETKFIEARKLVPHRRPGRPRRKTRAGRRR